MAWRDAGRRLLGAAGASVRRLAGAHVRVDGRRLFLSDAALCRGTVALGRLLAPEACLEVTPEPDGHLVRGLADGRPVSAVLVLERLRFEGGRLAVELGTPRGIALGSQPVVGFFAAVVARLFGGTWIGRRLLSLAGPDALVWDGAHARLSVPLDGVPLVGARLVDLRAEAVVTRADGGLWLAFDRDGLAQELAALLVRSVVEDARLGGAPGPAGEREV